MRFNRIKIDGAEAVYHCISRTVWKARVFHKREKEVFRKQMWQVAEFCGVEILTYCIMENHFHILVRVPGQTKKEKISNSELLRRLQILYPPRKNKKKQIGTASLFTVLEKAVAMKVEGSCKKSRKNISKFFDSAEEEQEFFEKLTDVRSRLLNRMGDVSWFMKELKQRFTIWFNKSHNQVGTLWSERFKSVLVENKTHALMIVAAYIDLNPIRAGCCEEPQEYRWSGYGEAVGGSEKARVGLRAVFSHYKSWREVQKQYRIIIYGEGLKVTKALTLAQRKAKIRVDHKRLSFEQREKVLKQGGALSLEEALRCRVRYFTDGAVLGSKEFVERWYEKSELKKWRKKSVEAKMMKGSSWGNLAVFQRLKRASESES